MEENKNRHFWLTDLEGMNCTIYFVYLGKSDKDPRLINSKKPVTKKEKKKLYKYIVNYLHDYCNKNRVGTDIFPDYTSYDKIVLFKGLCIDNNTWRNEITKIFSDLVLISNLKDITGDTEYKYCYIKYYFEFRFSEACSVSYNITDSEEWGK
jgi:hypothetical protein